MNANGMMTKKDEVAKLLCTHSVDVCCIEETLLKETSKLNFFGYKTHRCQCEPKKCRGIATLIRHGIPAEVVCLPNNGADWQRITLFDTKHTIIHCYNPPTNNLKFPPDLHMKPRTVIIGD